MTFPKTKKEIVEMWREKADHLTLLMQERPEGMSLIDLKARIATLRECATDLEYQNARAAKQKANADQPLDPRFKGGE